MHLNDVIKTSSCNNCHDQLSAHGGSRRGLDLCVNCHNPQNLDPNDGKTLDAKVFFHMTNSHGSFDYSKVVFPADPGDPRRCETRHQQTTGATQAVAFMTKPSRAEVVDPQGPINPVQATASARSGCHVDAASASHVLANTTTLGEACAVCHATGAAYAVGQVHAQY